MQTAPALVLAALAAATSVAHADPIKPMAPTWCGAYQADAADTMTGYIDDYGKQPSAMLFIETLGKSSCNKPSDAGRQKMVAGWRQKISDYYHLTEAENRDLMAAALAKTMDESVRKICNGAHSTATRTQEQVAQHAALGILLDCGAYDEAIGWFVDDADPSPLLRAAFVQHALVLFNVSSETNLDEDSFISGYARGGHDARALERGRLDDELAALGVTGLARLRAVMTFGEIKTQADRLTAYYKTKAKADPAIKKALFDIPDAAWDEWTKDAETWKAALDDEREVTAAFWHDKKDVLTACAPKLRKHVADYLAAKHAKTQAEALAALTDHVGYRLLVADHLCEGWANEITAHGMTKTLADAPAQRGPRLHLYYALLQLGDERAKWLGWVDKKTPEQLIYGVPKYTGAWAEPKGVVASIKPGKTGSIVTFKTNKWAEAIWNCVQTHRIQSIEPGGTIVYHQDCSPTGKFKTATQTEKPIEVSKDFASTLKVGGFAMFFGETAKKAGPTFVYADPDQKKLISVFGFRL